MEFADTCDTLHINTVLFKLTLMKLIHDVNGMNLGLSYLFIKEHFYRIT